MRQAYLCQAEGRVPQADMEQLESALFGSRCNPPIARLVILVLCPAALCREHNFLGDVMGVDFSGSNKVMDVREHERTYHGFVKITVVSTVAILVTLALMAIFLV